MIFTCTEAYTAPLVLSLRYPEEPKNTPQGKSPPKDLYIYRIKNDNVSD